ncbi:tyrosine recombinase XerH [Lachnospiraceae bacterium]|jgi:integrase/recombinase XerD|nr:tyrosine recombinase XerH [Lachnospiraceae bacterium]
MQMRQKITREKIESFRIYLRENEKAAATIQKYIREIELLSEFLDDAYITKEKILRYREWLRSKYQARTVNGKISAVNSYADFAGAEDCKVKFLRIQNRPFIDESRQLGEAEYRKLLLTAKKMNRERLYYMLLSICGTGIRVSELQYITVETVKDGKTEISMKGKNRTILLPKELLKKLEHYIEKYHISSGSVFQTRNGNPVNRSNICREMKMLCTQAGVDQTKVFPHNLRHLFARKYFEVEKNISLLADVLGHSSIETTRIYVAASVSEHEKILEKVNLIL